MITHPGRSGGPPLNERSFTMYRSYENPAALEAQLAELQARYDAETDLDILMELSEDIAALKDRINFAWQDDEYDCEAGF